MSEWFVGLGSQLATWLAASFLLYVLASQLAWQFGWPLFQASPIGSLSEETFAYPTENAEAESGTADRYAGRQDRHSDGIGRSIDRWHSNQLTPWVEEAVQFAYYLGIPFLAAINGLLGADLLGISGTDWLDGKNIQGFLWEDWAKGLGFAATAVLAIVVVWFSGRPRARQAGLAMVTVGPIGPLWQRLLHTLYDQIHWAFYRSGPILWLGDVYWGTFAGLALVLLEAALNPALWWSLRSLETAGPPLFRLGMAWISALLFLATHNLWLAIGVHLILAGLLGGTETDDYSGAYESAK
jgi:hypothetical protein